MHMYFINKSLIRLPPYTVKFSHSTVSSYISTSIKYNPSISDYWLKHCPIDHYIFAVKWSLGSCREKHELVSLGVGLLKSLFRHDVYQFVVHWELKALESANVARTWRATIWPNSGPLDPTTQMPGEKHINHWVRAWPLITEH